MKKLLMLVVFVFVAGAAFAETASDNGTAVAKIIAPILIEHQSGNLDFGVLIKPESAGSVVIDPVASPTPHDSNVQRAAGGVSSDHFVVDNEDGFAFTISLPDSLTVKDENGSGSNTMTVSSFTHSCTGSCTLDGNLYIGGTLQVGAGQPSGDYKGTYQVTLTY